MDAENNFRQVLFLIQIDGLKDEVRRKSYSRRLSEVEEHDDIV